MHDARQPAERGALIDGRSEFTEAVRRSLAQAVQLRERELCFVDPDFEVWPLDDQQVRELAARVDQLPAGAGVVGVLFTIFIVLLVTDILGFTKVFPFTRAIR